MTLEHKVGEATTASEMVAFYTPLQAYYIARLRRLDALLLEMEAVGFPWPELHSMAERVLVMTVADCIDAGLADVLRIMARAAACR